MLLSFESTNSPLGLEIRDHVERRRCRLATPDPVEPNDVPTEEFYFPVDRGVSVTTTRLSLPHTVSAYVRNHAGWMIAELNENESREFPEDLYSVELTAPIKLYVVFESPFSLRITADDVILAFEEPTELSVGARSHHKHPAATITTTDDPEDVMTAVSYFGSALKATSCERSYPTLRGHPPTIELGEELHVPSVLERPDTGVRLEVPSDYRSVFAASTLAYYLGATVEPGEQPRLVTDAGFVHPLDDPARGFEGELERVLKQVFFLDCVTRTEGYYPVNLHERNEIEGVVELDFERLYDQPLATQIERYLDVPYGVIDSHIPKWKLTAHVAPTVEHVEMLPFVVEDMAVIRTVAMEQTRQRSAESVTALEEFARSRGFTRSTTRSETDSVSTPPLVELEETDSLEQTWLGEGMPIGASKAMVEAFRNRVERQPADGDIDITVVCNDMAMGAERDIVNEIYGSRDELPFDVDIYRELTTDELRSVLQESVDFFHYIGHIDAEGFECVDGRFDAATLDHTGVDAFFLNACTSYQQGMDLIEAGSIAGVVTLQDVINSGAERVGKTLAQLLNQGFPLRVALNIAKTRSIMGGHYLVVGDGGLDIAQPDGGIPAKCEVRTINNQEFTLVYKTFPTRSKAIGSMTMPFIDSNDEYFLSSGKTGIFKIDENKLNRFLSYELLPVDFDNEFYWSNDLNI